MDAADDNEEVQVPSEPPPPPPVDAQVAAEAESEKDKANALFKGAGGRSYLNFLVDPRCWRRKAAGGRSCPAWIIVSWCRSGSGGWRQAVGSAEPHVNARKCYLSPLLTRHVVMQMVLKKCVHGLLFLRHWPTWV